MRVKKVDGNKTPNISTDKVYIVKTSSFIAGLFTNLQAVYDYIQVKWGREYQKSYSQFKREYDAGKVDGYSVLEIEERYVYKKYDESVKQFDEAA
jgi:hypothetical protein